MMNSKEYRWKVQLKEIPLARECQANLCLSRSNESTVVKIKTERHTEEKILFDFHSNFSF